MHAVPPLNIVPNEDPSIQAAIDLLAEGMSIRATADATGLSRRQVTKLKELPKEEDNGPFGETRKTLISQEQAVAKVLDLSTRPEGVKRSELGPILKARFGLKSNETTGSVELNMTKHQYRYLKESAQAKGHPAATPFFVPEWMPRNGAIEAHSELIKIASDLQDLMTEKVMELCNRFPGSSYKWVFQELVKLAIPNVFPGSVEDLCDRNLKAAEELDRRVGRMVACPVTVEPVPTSDAELDALCI